MMIDKPRVLEGRAGVCSRAGLLDRGWGHQ
jgi:hypothetical protein